VKIYTKTGDKGSTSLLGGTKVSKSELRIEAYGTVDELNAHIGLLKDVLSNDTRDQLINIQDCLFIIGAQLASDPDKKKAKIPELIEEDVTALEVFIDEMEAGLEPLRSFVLPGGHTSVSYCHIARAVCRRAERAIIRLSEVSRVDEAIIRYTNRLSDYLFVLSRKVAKDLNAPEDPWVPRT
jgi:cob(I)alamin adenosyltransferase